jgi:hypothetical protein
MTLALVEEAWLLWKRLAFRWMAAPHRMRRLDRLIDRARRRYFRRKRAIGGQW